MRITGGRCRGRVLRQPVLPGVRPTSDRVREALFSILGQDLSGLSVLDAFGGTGLLGFEAWSRGARVAIFEKQPRVAALIRDRARELGAEEPEFSVKVGNVLTQTVDVFDGILADPPWALDPIPILQALAPHARLWFVLEADVRSACPERAGALELERTRRYGRTALWVYRSGA